MAMTDLFLSKSVVVYIHQRYIYIYIKIFSRITSVFDWPSGFFTVVILNSIHSCKCLQRAEAVVFTPCGGKKSA